MYTQVLIYTHLHSSTATTLIYDSESELGPDSDADESWRDRDESQQSRQSRGPVTWMSHGSHETDADESRREHAGYQCLCCKIGAGLGTPGPTRMLMSHGGTSHGSHEQS